MASLACASDAAIDSKIRDLADCSSPEGPERIPFSLAQLSICQRTTRHRVNPPWQRGEEYGEQ